MTPHVAVDHFAGAGGWSVAADRLGIREYGVELMRDAIRTRTANRFRTIFRDVWAGLFHPWMVPAHDLYIASPPCQSFSSAGKGEGRAALGEVLAAIDDARHTNPAALHELGDMLDPRTALVLTPLAHVYAHRPRLVALEQVPEVLPIWHGIAAVLRTLGYSVWAGILRAEQFGVPQTRKRAFLMARLDGKVQPPTPTHSRYYSTAPHRRDPGVLPWVSMAEALGWGMTARPALTVTAGGAETGGYAPWPAHARAQLEAARSRGDWIITNQDTDLGGGRKRRYSRATDLPAPTLTGQVNSWKWSDAPATTVAGKGEVTAREHHAHGEQSGTALQLTMHEAATLQAFPPGFVFRGPKTRQYLQNGNAVPPPLAQAVLAALLAPPSVRDAWDRVFAEVAG